jgi:RNA polymerase sigma factor (sigma-70 family)
MSPQGKLQLTDRAGNLIAPRYIEALEKLRSELWRRYPQIRDESDRDNVMEDTLRRVMDYEEQFGPAENLLALIRHAFHWVAGSLLRQSYYRLRPDSMPEWRGDLQPTSQSFDPEERLAIQECLAQLSDREREVILLIARGFKAAHVGARLGITTANVYQIAHRARTKLLAAGTSDRNPLQK